MKSKFFVLFLCIVMLFTAACDGKSAAAPTVPASTAAEKIKPFVPFDERKFIYTNGITIVPKENSIVDDKGENVNYSYQVISGLKNKEVQDKLNQEFQQVEKEQLSKLEANLLKASAKDKLKINKKNAGAYINYSCNNVIFVDYYSNIDVRMPGDAYYPCFDYFSYGYDLNTGNRITLGELFKPGVDYKKKINDFICQYLIENNYDDYSIERMSKPFQGIRENQSFIFDTYGLRIILDEKNDEFVSYQYFDQINIPLKYLADDLYIFDRYFDEGKSIFENGKLSKKLLSNKLEFVPEKLIREENEKDRCYIFITQGKFANVPSKEIESRLNDMAKSSFDIDSFKEKVKAEGDAKGYSNYSYNVNVFMNAGGYLSVTMVESIYLHDKIALYEIKPFNYDFNSNKEMHLNDIIESTADMEKLLKKHAKPMNYPVSNEILDKAIKESLREDKFYFDEYGITIHLPLEESEVDKGLLWVWVPFQEIGMDNIKLYK